MGDLFSNLGGSGGGASEDDSGGGFGGFLRGMGTGFVNGRLGPNNSFTGNGGNNGLSGLFTSTVNNIGAQGNASPPNDPFATTSPLVQPGIVPAPKVSQFGSPVPATPNAQWGSDAWGTPQG